MHDGNTGYGTIMLSQHRIGFKYLNERRSWGYIDLSSKVFIIHMATVFNKYLNKRKSCDYGFIIHSIYHPYGYSIL